MGGGEKGPMCIVRHPSLRTGGVALQQPIANTRLDIGKNRIKWFSTNSRMRCILASFLGCSSVSLFSSLCFLPLCFALEVHHETLERHHSDIRDRIDGVGEAEALVETDLLVQKRFDDDRKSISNIVSSHNTDTDTTRNTGANSSTPGSMTTASVSTTATRSVAEESSSESHPPLTEQESESSLHPEKTQPKIQDPKLLRDEAAGPSRSVSSYQKTGKRSMSSTSHKPYPGPHGRLHAGPARRVFKAYRQLETDLESMEFELSDLDFLDPSSTDHVESLTPGEIEMIYGNSAAQDGNDSAPDGNAGSDRAHEDLEGNSSSITASKSIISDGVNQELPSIQAGGADTIDEEPTRQATVEVHTRGRAAELRGSPSPSEKRTIRTGHAPPRVRKRKLDRTASSIPSKERGRHSIDSWNTTDGEDAWNAFHDHRDRKLFQFHGHQAISGEKNLEVDHEEKTKNGMPFHFSLPPREEWDIVSFMWKFPFIPYSPLFPHSRHLPSPLHLFYVMASTVVFIFACARAIYLSSKKPAHLYCKPATSVYKFK